MTNLKDYHGNRMRYIHSDGREYSGRVIHDLFNDRRLGKVVNKFYFEIGDFAQKEISVYCNVIDMSPKNIVLNNGKLVFRNKNGYRKNVA